MIIRFPNMYTFVRFIGYFRIISGIFIMFVIIWLMGFVFIFDVWGFANFTNPSFSYCVIIWYTACERFPNVTYTESYEVFLFIILYLESMITWLTNWFSILFKWRRYCLCILYSFIELNCVLQLAQYECSCMFFS